jgi:hypothetical protein
MAMANTKTTLLTAEERRSLYSPPTLNESERKEYFTFSQDEIKVLKSFKKTEYSVYYAISLAFFKLKYTLVNFKYRDVTLERQCVMQRYFPGKSIPRRFPTDKDTIARIENKVLQSVNFSRFKSDISDKIMKIMQKQSVAYPRQRQLCKAFLNVIINANVAIPSLTTVQDCVSDIWNTALSSTIKKYYRYTTRLERRQVQALLNKTDSNHRIISIRKDMKRFNTEDIRNELDKHSQLKAIFLMGDGFIKKSTLPAATINYYAQLINYYNGPRLKQLNQDLSQLYLLCYCHSRFLIVNDNLLEALKKRTFDYVSTGVNEANIEAAKAVDEIKEMRQKMHDLLMAIKNDPHKSHMPKDKLFRCIPESDIEITAKMMLSDDLDKTSLFWKSIDRNRNSITLSLQPLFIALDISIVRNDPLKKVVAL